ncbi:TonB-dependent receptor [Mariniflexile litorale]|uniref:TonB-dependent receptor n=1 Tax=Mariniflexile litorale TaxID=3045158 RepID=A0AAU7EHR8_9FLAO|nr:TonB-dependent receptor [Mariniflexile sp. KMM 9835]MDQ8211937.1 TonB-dependent receptor [Mariniflexile sp. KMM 9835]
MNIKITQLHISSRYLEKINYFFKVLALCCITHLNTYASEELLLDSKRINNSKKINSLKNDNDIFSSHYLLDFTSINDQKNDINGIIYDEFGTPLPGATIIIVGTKGGVITDFDGKFTVKLKMGDKVQVSYLGYKSVTIEYNGQKELTIHMESDVSALDDVTVVAFSKQKKASVIGAITTVKPSDLKIPSSNLTTSFAGRIPGMVSYQRSGEPGQNTAEFYIRGITSFGYNKGPLILVDNNEVTTEELSRLHPDDIASFSVMKDATATALYGSRGANGVILVTTKEGVIGKAKISVRMEQASSSPTQTVDLADPITYMRLHNEAVRTRDPLGNTPYSPQKINNTIAGNNPAVYPANDWRKMLFKNEAINRQVNLNVSGGGKVARYYVAGSYSNDTGLLKVDGTNNFNNNIKLDRYMIRSNINIDITETTEAKVRLQGAFDQYSGPIDSGSDLYKKVMRTNPVLFPATFEPDEANQNTKHILFGNADTGGFLNPYADMVRGYKEYYTSQVSAQFELKQDLSVLLKGLSLRGMFNTNRHSHYNISRGYNPFYYKIGMYDKAADEYTLNVLNEDTGTEYLGYGEGPKEIKSTTYYETALNWNDTFNEKHEVSGLLVATARERVEANAGDLQRSLPYRNLGYAGRATYAFDSRYLFEFNFGYNGSERFSEKERFGFFPSVGYGWIVSNEKFWQGKIANTINKLKLRYTYGIVGNDAIGSRDDRFFYLSNVNLNDGSNGANFGTYGNDYSRNGVSISRYANDEITWEVAEKYNIGLEIGLWNKLDIDVDVFSENRTNVLMNRSAIPSTMGLQANVQANVGEASSKGLEFSFNFNHSFNKDFWITAMGNFTYATSQYEVYEEPDYPNEPWKSRIGDPIAQYYGYVAERLFVDDDEVKNSPTQFGDYRGGDIKYKDLNGDGKITDLDIVPLGNPHSPEIVYGFGFSGGWKGIDFSTFFQGLGRTSLFIDPYSTSPFINQQSALLQVYADNHWSEDNRNVYALWPRLSETIVGNNMQTSSWWVRDGSFLRLKAIELGYTIPSKITLKANIEKFRFYMNGTNLLTFSKFKLWDPEMGGDEPGDGRGNGLGYPIQKVINFGLQISF